MFLLLRSGDSRGRRKDLGAGKAGRRGVSSGRETIVVSLSPWVALSSTFECRGDAHSSPGDL